MKSRHYLVLSGLVFSAALAAGSAQAVTLQSIGYAIGTKQPLKATFADDMKKGIALTQDELGCTWASRPKIWAFDDAVVFVAEGGTDYNAFPTATALGKACWLPPSIAKLSGYKGLMPAALGRRAIKNVGYSTSTLEASGMPVPTFETPVANAAAPANFKEILKNGVQLTQRQLGCTWAGLPFIYAFADGVVFTDSNAKTYNAFSLREVTEKRSCWLPHSIIEGGEGDTDLNTNDETDKEEKTTNYIDTHNAAGLCLGRWRWQEKWDEGYTDNKVCSDTLVPYTVNVVDVDRGSADGFSGVTKHFGETVITEDLGVAEATTRTTDSGSASINNDAKTLQECWNRVEQWKQTKTLRRSVVNGFVVQNNPEYPNHAGLFQPWPVTVEDNKIQSDSPVIQGAKCTDTKLGGICVAYTNKRQCKVNYKVVYYTLHYKEEIRTKRVKDDPSCQPSSPVYVPVPKTANGQSKLNVTFGDLLTLKSDFVEMTSNKPRYDYVCSTGVHLRDTKPKYDFLDKYIADNMNKPGIEKDPEFAAAVATFWALYVEKSDQVADADAMGLTNILNVHNKFKDLVFKDHRDEDLVPKEDEDPM